MSQACSKSKFQFEKITKGRVINFTRPFFSRRSFELDAETMKHYIGIALQFITLVFLPLLIIWQLNFGFKLIYMPMLTVVGIIVFMIGTKLRG